MGKKNTESKGATSGDSSRAARPRSTTPTAKSAPSAPSAKSAKAAQRPASATATVARPPAKPRATRPARSKGSESRPHSNGHSHRINAEQIAIRAYFISERRRYEGTPGDPTNDWILAEQELLAEIGSDA